jgi:hypothetical protein
MIQETRRRGDGGVRSAWAPALLEVADQQVGAARIAELSDLAEQPGHRHARFLGQSAAQVVSVRVDQGPPVLGGTVQVVGGGGAGVTLDGVQRPARDCQKDRV